MIWSVCWCGRGSRAGPPALPSPEGGMGMPRGKSLRISPRSTQVARLRYSLVAISEKYTICLVSGPVGCALILRIAAPRIGRLFPLAECITKLTGMRSEVVSRSPDRSLGPARQLWQPVSAIASVASACVSSRSVCP